MFRFMRLIALGCVMWLAAITVCPVAPRIAQTIFGLTRVVKLLVPTLAIPTQDYVVQHGDTPSGVALMFGTTVATLIELNADTYPEMGWVPMKFNAGWRIVVPASSTAPRSTIENNPEGVPAQTDSVTVTNPSMGQAQLPNPPDGLFDDRGALDLIRFANDERAKVGLAPLAIDATLMEIARKRSTEIVTDWGHQGLDDDCSECGENIAKGGDVLAEFQWWMNSDGHRGGILLPDYTVTGVGRYIVNGKAYAVQLFK